MTADRPRLPQSAFLRLAAKFNWTCWLCEQGYVPGQRWEIDHVVPLARRGTNLLSNMALAHSGCNRDKGTA